MDKRKLQLNETKGQFVNSNYDHIIPQNRKKCGLDLYGNTIPCHKKANAAKRIRGNLFLNLS